MGGLFGIVSHTDCVSDLFYGTDYHSHMGTKRGGMAVLNGLGIKRYIHDISQSPFRSKFQPDLNKLNGTMGIGVISDTDDQPLIIRSHLGTYAIVTVGKINNLSELAENAFRKGTSHFSEMSGGEINPTELVATLINNGKNYERGILRAQELIEGSCSLLLLTNKGVYVARDKHGRTPLTIGEKLNYQVPVGQKTLIDPPKSRVVTMETSTFPNLDYHKVRHLGPGEIVLIHKNGIDLIKPPNHNNHICAFFWVYYGYPASSYEGINVEQVRYKCGAALAKNDDIKPDIVAGIPDSGTAHGIGYANESNLFYGRPFVKYTPTWPRSFMPQDQEIRDEVARMKLIPIKELIQGKSLLFCEDSIVRGTQLKETIKSLYDRGAKEVHMRVACPPLIFECKYLNFSRSKSELELAARRAIQKISGENTKDLREFLNPESHKYKQMVEIIRKEFILTSLKYQKMGDLVEAIGLPKDQLCTYCWDGVE
ncbi:MAG: amidophosphoribosyltransferase [Candidatus Lokiarchaeota archaeon]|nr:amidophosphoribosyltransferase [Candidatus Lokiarchaeota archaeon]